MTVMKTSNCISMVLRNRLIQMVLLPVLLVFLPSPALAQRNVIAPEKPSKYVELGVEEPKMPFFQGFTVSADLFPIGQRLFSDFGGFEGGLKLSLLNTYLPVVELGFGNCDHEDDNTHIRYKTSAPYFRIGLDYNLLKNKFQDNRLYIGARYGFSSYKFDISGPELTDPFWGGTQSFSYTGISTTSHWVEFVAGVQVKMLSKFHLGWTVRLKRELSSSKSDYSLPYYIPGYGTTTGDTCWGASFHLIFDLNWGKKKGSVKAALVDSPNVGSPVVQPESESTGTNDTEDSKE